MIDLKEMRIFIEHIELKGLVVYIITTVVMLNMDRINYLSVNKQRNCEHFLNIWC